ncbi:MAG: nuclear transport factor 2 family protein [Pyrinomonadaceae bacterium]
MRTVVIAILMTLGLSSSALGQYKEGSLEDRLIKLDRAWTHAELKGDKKTAGAMVADDYVGTTQSGEIEDKAKYLSALAPNADMVRSDDYKVRIFGNTAIMTHRATVEGVRNIQIRSTHVWMKRGGKWLIVAHHGSRISPPEDQEQEDPDQ